MSWWIYRAGCEDFVNYTNEEKNNHPNKANPYWWVESDINPRLYFTLEQLYTYAENLENCEEYDDSFNREFYDTHIINKYKKDKKRLAKKKVLKIIK